MSEFSQRDITNSNNGIEYFEAVKMLTPREVEVLDGVATGRTSREIGKKLNISYRTVQKHRYNI